MAIASGLAACQPAPAPIDQATLRDLLVKGMGGPPQAVEDNLRSRGFACEEAKMAWAKDRTSIGCSRRNGGNFLNVELARNPSGTRLASYRILESPQPLYGKAATR